MMINMNERGETKTALPAVVVVVEHEQTAAPDAPAPAPGGGCGGGGGSGCGGGGGGGGCGVARLDPAVEHQADRVPRGRGLHLSSFRLNVSAFCGKRWVHDSPQVY
jgi:hypothetical protein